MGAVGGMLMNDAWPTLRVLDLSAAPGCPQFVSRGGRQLETRTVFVVVCP
jgi:hypothetical protein